MLQSQLRLTKNARDFALPLASLMLVSIIALCYACFDRACDATKEAPKCLRFCTLFLNAGLVALCMILQVGFQTEHPLPTVSRMAEEEMLTGASYLLSLLVVAHSAIVRQKPLTPAPLRLWWPLGMGICLLQIHNHSDVGSGRYYMQVVRATAATLLCIIGLVARPPRSYTVFDPMQDEDNGSDEADGSSEARRRSGQAAASLLSSLTFTWMTPMLMAGVKKTINFDTLYDLEPKDETGMNMKKLEAAWLKRVERYEIKEAQKKPRPSLAGALHESHKFDFWIAGLLQLVSSSVVFIMPQLVHGLVAYADASSVEQSTSTGFGIALLFFIATFLRTICNKQYEIMMQRLGMRWRNSVTAMVFQKALRLSQGSKSRFGEGAIVSYMQIDANKLMWSAFYLHWMWSSPLQIALCTYLLYAQLGAAAFVAPCIMGAMGPINVFVMKVSVKYQKTTMERRDKRVKYLTELLQAIKGIKFFAWEHKAQEEVEERREHELSSIKTQKIYSALDTFLWASTPAFVSVGTFGFFTFAGGQLTATKAFTALTIFQLINGPLNILPRVAQLLLELYVSLDRLTTFFLSEEVEETLLSEQDFQHQAAPPQQTQAHKEPRHYRCLAPATTAVASPAASSELVVQVRHADFQWDDVEPETPSPSPSCLKVLWGMVCCCLGSAAAKEKEKVEPARKTQKGGGGAKQPLLDDGSAASEIEAGGRKGGGEGDTEGAGGSTPSSTPSMTLSDVNLQVRAGELVCLVGRVGAGKSSLLCALLNEIPLRQGSVRVRGSVGYCQQKPWVQSATVKENILFGRPYQQERYEAVIHNCALTHDIEILPDGDETEIGERGLNLSGGQQARVSLARAVYADADVLLLDDVLSAVDVHVCSHLLRHCILNDSCLGCKTRVIATHQLHWLHHADAVVVVEDGRIAATGTYAELVERGVLEKEGDHGGEQVEADGGGDEEDQESAENTGDSTGKGGDTAAAAGKSKGKKKGAGKGGNGNGKLTSAEERETGHVKLSVWLDYVRALTWQRFVPIVLLFMARALFQVLGSLCLVSWTDAVRQDPNTPTAHHRLLIYAVFMLTSGAFVYSRAVCMAFASFRASKTLHTKALWGVLRSPMSFFDSTPTGRIINRFASDMQRFDMQLSDGFQNLLYQFFALLSGMALIVFSTPYIAVILPPCIFLYRHFTNQYRSTARETQRLLSIARSPIYNNFNQVLSGLQTVRAFRHDAVFTEKNYALIERQARPQLCQMYANKWLTTRLELMGNLLVVGVAILIVLEKEYFHASRNFASLSGLALSYSQQVTSMLNYFMMVVANTETTLICLERIKKFCELSPEAPLHLDGDSSLQRVRSKTRPEKGEQGDGSGSGVSEPLLNLASSQAHGPEAEVAWPQHGQIVFTDVKMRYRPNTPLILRGINCTIQGGHKIGCVGRTGAGKSSLLVALFRLVEIEKEGSITIDGVDINEVGLQTLRSSLAVIPQDPTLFSGSLRQNLDPFGEYDDQELYAGLECVDLMGMVEERGGLDLVVDAGGQNLSVGQRQLLCMARTFLKKSKVILFDEATASIDHESEMVIQDMLRTHLDGCTVITIAHRINTIMTSDKILVLCDGLVAEYGAVQDLLRNSNSEFSLICEQEKSKYQKK